ncbi:MAG: BamA/TamA family outer membrane protein [Myxococcota bacterium]
MLNLLALLGAMSAAWAADGGPWYQGVPITQVNVVASSGTLPNEDFSPLLQSQQGDFLSLADVRRDVETLMRLGQFEAVEAHVVRWVPMLLADGTEQPTVQLNFQVATAPRLRRVHIRGVRGAARGIVQDGFPLDRGDPLYRNDMLVDLQRSLSSLLVANGWPDAIVQIERALVDDGRMADLNVVVDAGEPQRYAEVTVQLVEDIEMPRWRLMRQLRREGIVEGRRVVVSAHAAAQERLLDLLNADGVRVDLLSPRRRWLEARVKPLHRPLPAGDQIVFLVEPGDGLEIKTAGAGRPSASETAEALQLFPGDRVSTNQIPDYTAAVTNWFADQGYRDAAVDVSLSTHLWGKTLTVVCQQGGKHIIQKDWLLRRRIVVEGAETFTPRYISDALREAAPDSLGRDIVTDTGLTGAMRGVEEFYRGQGFTDTQITLTDERSAPAKVSGWRRNADVELTLVFDVDEGPRTWLTALDVRGGYGLEQARIETAQATLVGVATDLESRKPYIRARLEELVQEIQTLYRNAGYLNADVTLDVQQSTEQRLQVARATIQIQPGQQLILRSLIVQGNHRTQRDLIVDEIALEQGKPITAQELARSRAQLYDLGLFRVVSPRLIGDDDRFRDLIVSLEERPNILLELGGGISTDQGVRTTGRAVHRNLGGRAQRLSAIGQIGYGWQDDRWRFEFNEPVWRLALRYEAPNLIFGQTLIVETLLNELIQEPSFRLNRLGASVGVQLPVTRGFEAVLDVYRFQFRQLDDVEPGALVTQDPWTELLDDPLSPTLPSVFRYQGGPGLQLLYDWRNDRFNPINGGYVSSRLELGHALAPDPLFLKISARAEQLIPIGGVTGRLRFLGGLGLSRDGQTLPLEDRFFLGGANSLRGFALSTVGPANLTPRPEIDYPEEIGPLLNDTALRETAAQWVYTGGDTMVALSGELRTPLSRLGLEGWDTTELVLFADLGQVTFRDPEVTTRAGEQIIDEPLFRLGVGAGLRVATPIGPAAIDLGINPYPITERLEPRFVPHISLGAL